MVKKKVILLQTNRYTWDLVSPKGSIIVEGILLHSKQDAVNWVKAYVSSWTDWTYEIKPKETL